MVISSYHHTTTKQNQSIGGLMSHPGYRNTLIYFMTATLVFAVTLVAPTAQAGKSFNEYWNSKQLFTSVTKGDTAKVKKLLDKGANPEIFVSGRKGRVSFAEFNGKRLGPSARTPLMWAADNGKPEMVKLLLAGKANPNTEIATKETALFFAVGKNDLASVNLLIQYKADVNRKSKFKWTPLMIATGNGNEPIINALKQAGAKAGARTADQARFIGAVSKGDVTTVAAMLDKKSSVTSTDWHGYPAMFVAIRNKKAAVVKLLLERGADKNGKDSFNELTPLMYAAAKGDTQTITVLLDSGASLTVRNRYGTDVLYMAILNNKFDAAKLLITKGANPNQTLGKQKRTMLMQAAFSGRTDAVRFLLGNGADATIRDGRKMSALEHATRQDDPKIIHMLIKSGADKQFSYRGITAFIMSVINGKFKTAKALLKYKANINAPVEAYKGRTLLMFLAFRGNRSLKKVTFLLENGADANIRFNGMTALDFARRARYSDKVVALLEKHTK